MKISIFYPKSNFSPDQQKLLSKLGQVVYTRGRETLPLAQLKEHAKNADIIACDPDPFGGFEKAKEVVLRVMEQELNLKGVCLSTTSFGWVDLDYCKNRKLPVSNIPGYSRESVAEQALAFMLGASKRIFLSDRTTQKGKYSLTLGYELKGKTLGIVGLGNIGSRVAELAIGIGMNVIAYNRSSKKVKGVTMVSLNKLLTNSDFISLHTTHEIKNNNLISEEELKKVKKGVIIVNTVDRELVDEKAMAQVLKSGKVDTYVYEGEDLVHTPLAKSDNAFGFKGFAWYTKEALDNLVRIWVENIIACAKGKPQNRVV